jgi:hypothetical protein
MLSICPRLISLPSNWCPLSWMAKSDRDRKGDTGIWRISRGLFSFRKGLARQAQTRSSVLCHGRLGLTSTPSLPHHPGIDVAWHDSQPPPHFAVFSDSAALRRARGQRPPCSALLALVCGASIRASAPWRPLDHATALQHRRQSAGEDADVRRRGSPWLRQAARPMLAARDSPRRGAL